MSVISFCLFHSRFLANEHICTRQFREAGMGRQAFKDFQALGDLREPFEEWCRIFIVCWKEEEITSVENLYLLHQVILSLWRDFNNKMPDYFLQHFQVGDVSNQMKTSPAWLKRQKVSPWSHVPLPRVAECFGNGDLWIKRPLEDPGQYNVGAPYQPEHSPHVKCGNKCERERESKWGVIIEEETREVSGKIPQRPFGSGWESDIMFHVWKRPRLRSPSALRLDNGPKTPHDSCNWSRLFFHSLRDYLIGQEACSSFAKTCVRLFSLALCVLLFYRQQ